MYSYIDNTQNSMKSFHTGRNTNRVIEFKSRGKTEISVSVEHAAFVRDLKPILPHNE